MYVVTVVFSVGPDHIGDFRAAMAVQARASLEDEPDCHQFDVAYDPDDPAACFLYELYRDKAAFDGHFATPHFKAFDATVAPWIASKHVRRYERAWPE